jgi:hypothetical protein
MRRKMNFTIWGSAITRNTRRRLWKKLFATNFYVTYFPFDRMPRKWEINDYLEEILYLALNEIYARHGYIFKDEDLQNYFMGQV